MNCTRRLAPFILALLLGSPTTTIAVTSVHRVGILALGSDKSNARDVAAIRDQLNRLGYAEGRNLIIESRFTEGQSERLPGLAAELVRLKVDVIVTITTPAALAAKAATSNIPIVMAGSATPVELGLVNSLARPGANVTGVTNSPGSAFPAKQLQLLKEAAPGISRVAVLMTSFPFEVHALAAMQAAGPALGVTLVAFKVESPTFTAENRMPAIYGERDMVEAGGLMSYWTDWLALRRHAAEFVDRILKGAKPADLPVENPTRFELIINLKTAKALGLTIPQSVLLRADEVIE